MIKKNIQKNLILLALFFKIGHFQAMRRAEFDRGGNFFSPGLIIANLNNDGTSEHSKIIDTITKRIKERNVNNPINIWDHIKLSNHDYLSRGSYQTTPLLWTIECNQIPLLKELLRYKADPNQGIKNIACSPLMQAIMKKNSIALKKLLKAGANAHCYSYLHSLARKSEHLTLTERKHMSYWFLYYEAPLVFKRPRSLYNQGKSADEVAQTNGFTELAFLLKNYYPLKQKIFEAVKEPCPRISAEKKKRGIIITSRSSSNLLLK